MCKITGRAINHHSALRDAFAQAISITKDQFSDKSQDYEGKLVHLIGELSTHEPLGDSNYNILVQAVKLRKVVEIYQWHEDYTENKFANDETGDRNYFYYKDWSERIISTQSFHSIAYQNPKKKPMESKIVMAEKVYIGQYEICEEAKDKFNTWIDITSDTKPEDYFIKMHSGAYYHCEDLFDPKIGDMRVRFQLAGLEGDFYTIVGKFNNGQIVPYTGVNQRRKILLLRKGSLSIEDIFHQEHSSVWKELWFTRAFGFIVIMFSVISMENIYRITCKLLINFNLSVSL